MNLLKDIVLQVFMRSWVTMTLLAFRLMLKTAFIAKPATSKTRLRI